MTRVLPGSRERAYHEASHCAALCVAGLVPSVVRTDFPDDAAGSMDIDWGEGGQLTLARWPWVRWAMRSWPAN
jgi:hypothetical protein